MPITDDYSHVTVLFDYCYGYFTSVLTQPKSCKLYHAQYC